MKILIDVKKANFRDNLNYLLGFYNSKEIIISKYSDIIVYELKTFFKFLLKKECNKIVSELNDLPDVQLLFTDTVDEEIKSYFTSFPKISLTESFIENLEKIIKYQKYISKLQDTIDIAIFSGIRDNNIFRIIDNIKDITNVISIVTHDEDFFNEVSEYAFMKYGLLTNIKKSDEIRGKDFCIVLNTTEQDFLNKSKFTIDIYMENKITDTNLLVDFYNEFSSKLSDFSIKKALFVEKADNLLNIKWKIVKKKLTN